MKQENHLSRFLKLKCAGDVINAVAPINNFEKEITEAWAIVRVIRPLILSNPGKYNILDLCAGNALTSVLSVFLLPITYSVAVDIKPRKRRYETIDRFEYVLGDVNNWGFVNKQINKKTIIVSSHPCQNAVGIANIFNYSKAKALCMIPCCNGSFDSVPGVGFLRDKMCKYDIWSYFLLNLIDQKTVCDKLSLTTDYYCISPKNNVLYAEKNKGY